MRQSEHEYKVAVEGCAFAFNGIFAAILISLLDYFNLTEYPLPILSIVLLASFVIAYVRVERARRKLNREYNEEDDQ